MKDFFVFYDKLQLNPKMILLDVLEAQLIASNTVSFFDKKNVHESTFLQFILNAGELVLPTNNLKVLDVEPQHDGITLKPTNEIKDLLNKEFIARMRKSILLYNARELT